MGDSLDVMAETIFKSQLEAEEVLKELFDRAMNKNEHIQMVDVRTIVKDIWGSAIYLNANGQ